MSYILDALRKSDQLRQRGAAPTLLLGQATAAAPKKPAPLFYGLLALVLLLVGIAIGWLRPWQPQPAPMNTVAKLPQPGPGAAPAPQPEMAPQPQNSAPAVAAPAPALKQAPGAASAKIVKPRRARPRVVAKAKKKAAPLPEPSPASRQDQPAAAPVPSAMAMAELPLAIQQELPFMSISVHAYSGNPAERLVGINGRLLHEGEDVAPGLRLESITPVGMILSYRGYTFSRGVH